jgi:hypothetical protein
MLDKIRKPTHFVDVSQLTGKNRRSAVELMERETGIEPVTSSLGIWRQPYGQHKINHSGHSAALCGTIDAN